MSKCYPARKDRSTSAQRQKRLASRRHPHDEACPRGRLLPSKMALHRASASIRENVRRQMHMDEHRRRARERTRDEDTPPSRKSAHYHPQRAT
ncbi:hypothetical protein PLICRDRAFT_533713 [Plicaturopsis crispa FD-325 SS-3]|nr:hypothetical protein PLICRDRAFT_533713 [Plicaturopsis crispa FD-325 SS-3]